jgi:hypothetical protein
VKHVTVPDNTSVNPGASLIKTWRVRNDSALPWPEQCQIIHIGGESFGAKLTPVRGSVPPNTETDITLHLTAPTSPGSHQGFFRLSTAQRRFGQRLWISVLVNGSSSDSEDFVAIATASSDAAPFQFTEGLACLNERGFNDDESNRRLLTKFRGNVERVTAALSRKSGEDASEQ